MKKQIHDALSTLLSKKLSSYVDSKLDASTCTSIYRDVFDTLVSVFQESQVEISNEAVNLVAQMYYDSININGSQELDPNIFDKRAKLENVATKELAMLATMFRGTPFEPIFVYEVKKRS
jgi:hypothetical protein